MTPHHTYTSCRTCGGFLDLSEIEYPHLTHVGCKRTRREALTAEYLAAIHRSDTAETTRIGSELDRLDEREQTLNLGRAALTYARDYDWPVFPLRPGDKRPLSRHGFQDATTDPERIERWWRGTPTANIGVPTGVRFDVLDIDWRDKDGGQSQAHILWPQIRDHLERPDIHGMAITPRGGLHVLFSPTGEGNHATRWCGDGLTGSMQGLDFRGRGGYIVVSPSRSTDPPGQWGWAVYPSPVITGRVDRSDDLPAA